MEPVIVRGTVETVSTHKTKSDKEIATISLHVGQTYNGGKHIVAVSAFGQKVPTVRDWMPGDKVELQVMPESRSWADRDGVVRWSTDMALRTIVKHEQAKRPEAGGPGAGDDSPPF